MSDAPVIDPHPVAAEIDILIPTRNRPVELATTLAGLAAQTGPAFRVVVSDQSDETPSFSTPSAATLVRALRRRGTAVDLVRNPTRRGIAEQRAFLLARATANAVLYLDDDVWLEPGVLDRLHRALTELRCGFVAAAMQGLSHLDDRRPHEWRPFEAWQGDVLPETLVKDGPEWSRWTLHNAANGVHLAERFGLDTGALPSPRHWLAYKIAWAAGCVLFDRQALLDAGGFDFWSELPADGHGEDVLSQLRVMARRGGAGVLPSGAYHQESPTTLPVRSTSAVDVLAGTDRPARPRAAR
jgi:GT2 family glycosyltransferase